MELAVIIVSWNVRELLRTALDTLYDDLVRTGVDASVWVVDNASSDGSPDMLAETYPRVHLIASDKNLGFASGNNVALRQILRAGTPPQGIWLLNPDTEVCPGATQALFETLQAHSQAGVIGAKLLNSDGSLQHSAFRFPGPVQMAFDLYHLPTRFYETWLNGRYRRSLYEGTEPFPVDHPLGASMLVRTEAVSQVGLLDEAYHMYCEEIDWCWRMRKAGWHALCAPQAQVIHHAGQSTGQIPVASFANLWISRARLYQKHHGPLRRALAQIMVQIAMRREAKGADPDRRAACQRVSEAWSPR